MAVAKRTGPDFLFLANANSQKFDDIEKNGVSKSPSRCPPAAAPPAVHPTS